MLETVQSNGDFERYVEALAEKQERLQRDMRRRERERRKLENGSGYNTSESDESSSDDSSSDDDDDDSSSEEESSDFELKSKKRTSQSEFDSPKRKKRY